MTTRRKSSEPACRACACTEHAACDEGCSWVKVEKGTAPLCSACSGQVGDMTEVLIRIKAMVEPKRPAPRDIATIIKAALKRRIARLKLEEAMPDKSWGGR